MSKFSKRREYASWLVVYLNVTLESPMETEAIMTVVKHQFNYYDTLENEFEKMVENLRWPQVQQSEGKAVWRYNFFELRREYTQYNYKLEIYFLTSTPAARLRAFHIQHGFPFSYCTFWILSAPQRATLESITTSQYIFVYVAEFLQQLTVTAERMLPPQQ